MLFFRSEEHVDRWCGQWRLERGAVLPLDLGWRLAQAWYGVDRRDPQSVSRTDDDQGVGRKAIHRVMNRRSSEPGHVLQVLHGQIAAGL